MAITPTRKTFGKEVERPEREVKFTGEELASLIQAQFTKVAKEQDARQMKIWEDNGRKGNPPRMIKPEIIMTPYTFERVRRRDNRRSENPEKAPENPKMTCYYISMPLDLQDTGSRGGRIASIYNSGHDNGIKIRPAYWNMLQPLVYRPEFKKLMLDDDSPYSSQWQQYGLGSHEARENFFKMTKPHIIKKADTRIGILLNPDSVHKMALKKWQMEAHPELNERRFNAVLNYIKRDDASWLNWIIDLLYIPNKDDNNNVDEAQALQDMIENLNDIRKR